MALRSRRQKKSRTVSLSESVQRLEQSRPLASPTQQDAQLLPNLQTQLERAQRFGHHLENQSYPTQQPAPLLIQPKLKIGAPGDQYEQEADRVARQVVQQLHAPQAEQASSNQSLQRESVTEDEELQMKPAISQIQRQELAAEDEDLQMKPLVQRQGNIGGGEASSDLEASIQQARGSGQRLDKGLRQKMGQAMGADFSGVRVHTDAQSDLLNQSIQAKAFTTKQDIFFRKGAYNPSSLNGQELIAHELTHVLQQSEGGIATGPLVQRTLAYNQPINVNDITTIARVSADKEVYVLSGNGTVVVKIETGSASEGTEEGAARWGHGLWLAQNVLAGVPGAELLSATDRQILETLPDTLGADAITLRESLKYYGSHNFPQFPVKMETVQMGENLKERIAAAKTSGVGGRLKLTQVLSSDEVWTEMGKMAVFDLLMDNADRFQANGTCNLENLDFTTGTTPALKPLDNFNPSVDSTLRPETVWKGKNVLKGGIQKQYVTLACNHIYQAAYGRNAPDNYQKKFQEGMIAGRDAVYQLKSNLEIKILNLPKGSKQKTSAEVLLGRVKSIKKK
jgi:hypothetical protein